MKHRSICITKINCFKKYFSFRRYYSIYWSFIDCRNTINLWNWKIVFTRSEWKSCRTSFFLRRWRWENILPSIFKFILINLWILVLPVCLLLLLLLQMIKPRHLGRSLMNIYFLHLLNYVLHLIVFICFWQWHGYGR